MSNKMLFLSNSIDDPQSDIIGFETYASNLNDSIDEGARMIAVTSPFGSGKTSIVELLKKKRSKNKREKFLSVQMWSELNELKDINKTCELHKNFLYQIGSSISPRKGTYINRRLSNNYGLLKLHINRPIYWIMLIFSLFFAFLGWIVKEHSDFIFNHFSCLKDSILSSPYLLFGAAVILAVLVVARAEIIFSSNKSENERKIEADEIIDLYRSEIINEKNKLISFLCHILKKCPLVKKIPILNSKRYIVVIEDLDRTDDGEAVIHFLKELRKYYIPINNDKFTYSNQLVFIVNIKPESTVMEEIQKTGTTRNHDDDNPDDGEGVPAPISIRDPEDFIYAKVFDYILNLQTINIIDYNTILSSILEEKKDYINNCVSCRNTNSALNEIPGMQWIITGANIDIREIKKRLNNTFVIFETLKERFPNRKNDIDFQKCAITTYITSEFELEFSKTDDKAFDELIKLFLRQELDIPSTKKILDSENENYVKTIYDLVTSKLIEEDYRIYFYNYPKHSVMYSSDEMNVQKAILYGTVCADFDATVEKVVNSGSNIVPESLKRLQQLSLSLPQTVLRNEQLFLAALRYEYSLVLEMFERLNPDSTSLDKNISNIMSILNYDSKREVYKKENFKDFCNIWEEIFEEQHILKLREVLCEQCKDEILIFEQLFFGDHSIITLKEMDFISFNDSLQLLNTNSKNFSISHLKHIVTKFNNVENPTDDLTTKICKILSQSCELFESTDIADLLIEFMNKTHAIIPEFENIIYDILSIEEDDLSDIGIDADWLNALFDRYKELICTVPVENISDDVFEHIYNFDSLAVLENPYEFSNAISRKLYEKEYFLHSTLIDAYNSSDINFSDSNIILALKENIKWLKSKEAVFLSIRRLVLTYATNLSEYLFLFSQELPILSKEDFALLVNNECVHQTNVLEYFPEETINEEAIEYIVKYLNKEYINNNVAFDILVSLEKYKDDIILSFFKKINFSRAILYYKFARAKKAAIKRKFAVALDLDTDEGMLSFMELTKFLDPELEKRLLGNMDSDKEQRYINLIRKRLGPLSVDISTIDNLKSFSTLYPFSPHSNVNQKLFEEKEYIYYVVSTTLYGKKFELHKEKSEELWTAYIEIFAEPTKYSNTRGYMKQNKEFLELIVTRSGYIGFPTTALESLSAVAQSENLINHIFAQGKEFVLKYFAEMNGGFINYDAAKAFINNIALAENRDVLGNDAVRENIYDKLVDPGLKTKYTKLRKSVGCEY
ncbi:MAG: hypothetical protein E7471_05125 [Ruminococcaceae bacterium]|nr:hypothetical protein [Oscillospiraceae bacterium]